MSKLTQAEQDNIAYVKDYMEKIRSGDLVLNSEMAQKIMPTNIHAPRFSLGGLIAEDLTHHRNAVDLAHKATTAKTARYYIEMAWDQGIISEGKGVIGKLENCQREQIRVENELTLLSKKFETLDEENKNLKAEVERLNGLLYQKRDKP
jgi:hypothetical protein